MVLQCHRTVPCPCPRPRSRFSRGCPPPGPADAPHISFTPQCLGPQNCHDLCHLWGPHTWMDRAFPSSPDGQLLSGL